MVACSFIGHKNCPTIIKPNLYKVVESLITQNNVTKFYVGNHGSFDRYVYDVLCELKKHYEIDFTVVLAYLNQKNEYVYYEENQTLFPSVLEKVPLRFAINKRNEFMIHNSQYLICYINNTFTNTYTFVKKAVCKNLNIINLGNYDLNLI